MASKSDCIYQFTISGIVKREIQKVERHCSLPTGISNKFWVQNILPQVQKVIIFRGFTQSANKITDNPRL